MLQLFLKLIEKLLDLARIRESRDQKRFAIAVTDVMAELKQIHANYLLVFEECGIRLDQGQSFQDVLNYLKVARTEHEEARQRISELVAVLKNDDRTSDFKEFLDAVGHYFQPASSSSGGDSSKRDYTPFLSFADMLGLMVSYLKGDGAESYRRRKHAQQEIWGHIQNLRTRWRSVSRAHAQLVVKFQLE